MVLLLHAITAMVLLIGNYPPDRQQSMDRFARVMLEGLALAGIPAELLQPQPFFGRFQSAGGFVAKWLAYLDKFVLFPRRLRRKLKVAALVHICDHSNAMYARRCGTVPVVVTCHDLLAVRGALGEETDCPASVTGKLLQRWIVAGLRRASAVACVSRATLADARRLVARDEKSGPRLELLALGLSYPYRKLPAEETRGRLMEASVLPRDAPFILHVGSNLRRKNREGVLRIFARGRKDWNGLLVFVGEPLSDALHSLGLQLGVADRIVEVPAATNELLEALYNCATALLFPSTFEGFGWPIAEAHACGCPVICIDREPMIEVAGGAALLHAADDEAGFAADVLRLTNPAERRHWSAKALENAKRFSTSRMITEYEELYRSLARV